MQLVWDEMKRFLPAVRFILFFIFVRFIFQQEMIKMFLYGKLTTCYLMRTHVLQELWMENIFPMYSQLAFLAGEEDLRFFEYFNTFANIFSHSAFHILVEIALSLRETIP